MSWLTLLNDNGQSFDNAELLVVAGRLNVESDFESLADPPEARSLQLTCYPIGSTAAGSPVAYPVPPAPPPAPMAAPVMYESVSRMTAVDAVELTVTGARMKAAEENLGDLKLYRVPERVTVSAKGLKQVAFLDQERVEGRLLYRAACDPYGADKAFRPTARLLVTVNDKRHGLGMALPQGGITFFEPAQRGVQLVAEETLRDHAKGQDVEIVMGESSQVQALCERVGEIDVEQGWAGRRATLVNANPVPVTVRLQLGDAADFALRGLAGARVKDGQRIVERVIPANGRITVAWQVRSSDF